MIRDFIDLLEKYIEILNNKIEESNEYNKIKDLLDKIKSNGEITDEDLSLFNDIVSKIELEESDIKRLRFISFLIKNNKDLDDSQKELLNKTVDKVKEKDNSNGLKELKAKCEYVKYPLEMGEHFLPENFEDLVVVFSALEASNDIEFDSKTKLEVIREIIEHNFTCLDADEATYDAYVEDNDNVFEEQELSEEDRMDESKIEEILERFGYSYNSFDNKNKEYLLKHASESKMVEVLTSLKNVNIHFGLRTRSERQAFCKILIVSSEKTINEFTELCDENNINAREFIMSQVSVLIPNTIRRINKSSVTRVYNNSESEATCGTFANFKENIKYLRENGYNIGAIVKDNTRAITVNPNILKGNLEILRDVYGISMLNGKGFSGVMNGTAIEILDRVIESSRNGYYWIRQNHSRMKNLTEREIYCIKVSEAAGFSLIHKQGTDRWVKYDEKSNAMPSEQRVIVSLSNSDLQKRLGLQVPDFTSNDRILDPLVETHFSTRPSETILSNPFIRLLDKNYKQNEYLYDINGTLISRQKVLRVCQILLDKGLKLSENEIKYAISYKSLLNGQDINNIERFRFIKNLPDNGGKKLNG